MKREAADAETGGSPSRSVDVTLKIPRPLYEQLKQVIEGSGFHSVTEFAVYVLRDLVSHRGQAVTRPLQPEPGTGDVDPLSPDEIEAIRQRLSSLGYL
ncbi:MAG TPA: CopG family transcriptional regulator [Actinomycetota bacterium]|nr:CopG family transcriptional regulator [Actinomycetota bacterium]